MPATLTSRLPAISAELRPRVSAAVKETAELVAQSARERAPDRPPIGEGLVAAIHVERTGGAEYAVVAGDDQAFYGHMVEHGTSHSAPHPFLVPALEEHVDDAIELVYAALRTL